MEQLIFDFLGEKVTDGFICKIGILGFVCVGVPKNKINLATKNEEVPSSGIYFLVNTNESRLSKRYIYVGQTKTGPNRLARHKATKKEWNMAYMFLGPKSVLDRQVVDELEALEIKAYKKSDAFDADNEGNNKAEPSKKAESVAEKIEDILTFFGYGLKQSSKIINKIEDDAGRVYKETEEIDPNEKIYLDTEHNISGKKPYKFVLCGKEYCDGKISFKRMLREVCATLFEKDDDKFEHLAELKGENGGTKYVTNVRKDTRDPIEVSRGIYVESNLSAPLTLRLIKFLLNHFGISEQEFFYFVK